MNKLALAPSRLFLVAALTKKLGYQLTTGYSQNPSLYLNTMIKMASF
jgi:hypothetical protein